MIRANTIKNYPVFQNNIKLILTSIILRLKYRDYSRALLGKRHCRVRCWNLQLLMVAITLRTIAKKFQRNFKLSAMQKV